MSETTEKRTVEVPSCLVTKQLIKELGERLEKETWLKEHTAYTFYSRTKNIKSSKVEDFVNADWGAGWIKIEIDSKQTSPSLGISIDFRKFYSSDFSVAGKNPTQVDGITKGIEEIFDKHRTSYHRIKRMPFLLLSTFVTILVFSSPLILQTVRLGLSNSNDLVSLLAAFSLMLFGFGGLFIFNLYNWLMPKFEYEGMTQQRIRKWIVACVTGSGIIAIILGIILRLFGID